MTTPEWRTAIHEAAHAVLVLRLAAGSLEYVTVEPDQWEESNGHTKWEPDTRGDDPEACTRIGVAFVAGPIAVTIRTREEDPRRWDTRDYFFAFHWAADWGIDERAYLEELEETAREELRQCWEQVEAVARTLMERRTLTARQVEAILSAVSTNEPR